LYLARWSPPSRVFMSRLETHPCGIARQRNLHVFPPNAAHTKHIQGSTCFLSLARRDAHHCAQPVNDLSARCRGPFSGTRPPGWAGLCLAVHLIAAVDQRPRGIPSISVTRLRLGSPTAGAIRSRASCLSDGEHRQRGQAPCPSQVRPESQPTAAPSRAAAPETWPGHSCRPVLRRKRVQGAFQ
jgi:hypothetical protein